MSLTTHRSRPFSSSQRLPEPEQPPVLHEPEEAGALLAEFIQRHPRLLILTGAGVSTDSGIPDYRDGDGAWKRKQPVPRVGRAPSGVAGSWWTDASSSPATPGLTRT